MNKFKRFIPFILALIMALAIPMAGCDSCAGVKKTLQSISIDTDGVKTEFVAGEEFTSEGLVVKASYLEEGAETPEEVTLKSGDYQVDSSAYKKYEAGTYSIKVSYTYEGVTQEGSYDVNVMLAEFDGLEVTFAEGTPDTYTLTAEQKTAVIDITKIVVKEINADGTVGGAISEYTAKLFKGQQEVAVTDGKATVDGGAYTIWVEAASKLFPGFTRTSFCLVYVNDDIVNFELKSGNFTQTVGADEMTATWVFEATYASGATKDIKADDCEYDIDTMNVAKDVPLEISYTDYNAKGEATTKSLNTTYTINMVYGKTTYTYDYSKIDNSNMEGDNTPLKQSDLNGVNSFLKLGGGTAVYRNKTKWNAGADVIEIKSKDNAHGLKVTFYGIGKITIGFSSTGSKNWSSVGLADSANNYVAAEYDTSDTNIKVDDKTENLYLVFNTVVSELTFNITKPGTYSIVAAANTSYNRTARIHSVVMEDNVDDPANIVCDADFTDTAKFATGDLAKSSATAPVAIKDKEGQEIGVSVTKSHSFTANRITSVNNKQVLQLQGSATTEQNSLVFNVKAGTVKITVKYFHSSLGRFIDILNADGTVLANSEASSTAGTDVVEFTFTLDIAEDTILYLGSHSQGINITYLKIEKV